MYAVIMAGGGGTRLHPLSRPERPKPFLPLLGDGRCSRPRPSACAPLTDDITVVTDRRYEHGPRAAPRRPLLLEPLGRNTAAAIALATLAIDRPADEVMVVSRPTRHRARGGLPRRAADRRRGPRDRGLRHRGPAGDPRGPGRPARPPTTATSCRTRPAARTDRRTSRAYPLTAFEEKPTPARAEQLGQEAGVAWNAGIFLWRRRAIRAALERYTGLLQTLGPMIGSPSHARARVRIDPARALDRLRGDGGRRPRRPGRRWARWTSAGRTSARGPRCWRRSGRAARAPSSRPGETVEVGDDDLVDPPRRRPARGHRARSSAVA